MTWLPVQCPGHGADHDPKTRRIEVRLSDEERQLDAAAASALGESLSDFFRRAAQTRAQEVLADQRAIALSDGRRRASSRRSSARRGHSRSARRSPPASVSEEAALTERYDPARHEVADFACGKESLDRWLHRYAGQGERRDATRTFVAADERGYGARLLHARRRPAGACRGNRGGAQGSLVPLPDPGGDPCPPCG